MTHFIWLVMRNAHFSHLNNSNDIFCGHVRMFEMLSIIFWTIWSYDLTLQYRQKYRYSNAYFLCFSCGRFVFVLLFDFMLSLSKNNQADVVEAFSCTSKYLDSLLNIDNPYFEHVVSQIYPTELK